MRIVITILVALCVIAALGAAFAGGYWVNDVAHPDRVELTAGERVQADSSAKLQKRILEELQGRYYKKIDPQKLNDAGIKGMLKALKDPYTEYMSPEESKKFAEKTSGSYSGIGAVLEKSADGVVITKVFDDSPAKEVGLVAGDTIVTVDGEPLKGKSVDESVSLIKGEEGSQVTLKVRHKGEKKPESYTATRRQIKIPETRTKMIEKNGHKIGYIQLFAFAEGVGKTVRDEAKKLESQGAEAIILDLRYNGGGLVDEAIKVSGDFLPQDSVVVSTEGLHSPKEVYRTENSPITDLPLVVMINEYSASASEITAGALRDNDRATLIGTKSFGKGVGQNVVDLPGGGTLKITTFEYRTPDGHDVNKVGLKPDVKAVDLMKTKPDEALDKAVFYLVQNQ